MAAEGFTENSTMSMGGHEGPAACAGHSDEQTDGPTENDVGVQGPCSAPISRRTGKPTKTIDFIEILQKVGK
jgi:hypothetical protein